MKKIVWIAPLLAASLFAAELSEEEIAQEKTELESAEQAAEEAKAEIAAANAKLKDAQKRIEKVFIHSGKVKYKTKTALSYSNTKGNTDTTRFGLDFHGERKRKKNTITLDVDALQSSSNGIEDNNKWCQEIKYQANQTGNTTNAQGCGDI